MFSDKIAKFDLKKLKMVKRRIYPALILSLLLSNSGVLLAQSGDPDFMQSIGKIYVVVAVILAAFAGIVCFLIYLDRRLTNIENQIKEHE